MLLFGHTGVTAGVVKACGLLVSITRSGSSYQPDPSSKLGTVIVGERWRPRYLLNGIEGRVASMDYRVVLLGSLLPDIIDKPVWFFVTSSASLGGRDYAHTLLFNLALFIGGLALIRYRKSWLLVVSLSSFMHLILDQMWNSPDVLLWPLFGSLPKKETVGWLSNIFQALISDPEVYVPEIIGLLLMLLFAYRLVKRRGVTGFIRNGATI